MNDKTFSVPLTDVSDEDIDVAVGGTDTLFAGGFDFTDFPPHTGRANLVGGATNGGPHVRVFDGSTPSASGDGTDDLVTGAGTGGGPHVR